jgi:hypothetical protein
LKIVFIRKGQTTCEFPKNIYFGSDFTFLDFKKYLIKVFKFISNYSTYDIRLWKLSPSVGFLDFMNYYRSQYTKGIFL